MLMSRSFCLVDEDGSGTVAKLTQATSPLGRQLGNITIFENYEVPVIDVIVVTGLSALGYGWLHHKMSTSAISA